MHDDAIPVMVQSILQSAVSFACLHHALARLVALAPICESVKALTKTIYGFCTKIDDSVPQPTIGLELDWRIDKIEVSTETATIQQRHQTVSPETNRHIAQDQHDFTSVIELWLHQSTSARGAQL
jgi:hypothetical protein